MDEATSGDALLFGNVMTLIDDMLSHDTMVFSFTPFQSGRIDTIFDLRGLMEKIIQTRIIDLYVGRKPRHRSCEVV